MAGARVQAWLIYSVITTVVYAIIDVAIIGIALLGKLGVLGALALVALCGWAVSWELGALLAIPAVSAMLAGFFATQSEEYRPVEPKLLAQRVIGEPGAGLTAAIDKFGIDNVTKGIAGEQITSDEFAGRVDDIPVVQLVNGLAFPGTENADVDHALVYGSKVAFIDSKYWPGSDFRWQGESAITSGRGTSLSIYEIHFTESLKRLSEKLTPQGKTVRGWVVVHSNSGRTVEVESSPANLPTLATGEAWLGEVVADSPPVSANPVHPQSPVRRVQPIAASTRYGL